MRRTPWALLLVSYASFLAWSWRANRGFTLTSADDATRLLIADCFGRYGVLPIHWTWPPLPMVLDGLLIPDGGDLLSRAVCARVLMLTAVAVLLARFWTRAFAVRWSLPGTPPGIAALWLYSPTDVRLALSGLSEPYLYLLLAIGLCSWQRAGELAAGGSRGRIRWACAAGVAFGLSTWCRYEGGLPALLLAAECGLRASGHLRSRRPGWRRAALVELAPALPMAVFPLAWLAVQYAAFGDPLVFVKQTRAIIHEEALTFHGVDSLPLSLAVEALRKLWSPGMAGLALAGLLRLAFEGPRTFGGLLALVVLYAGMALASFGGRMEFYLNVFGLAVVPLAVKGAEGIVCALATAWARVTGRTRDGCLRAGSLFLAFAVACHVMCVDVRTSLAHPLGDWLLPEHLDTFARLRGLGEEERALVVLDPSRMSRDDHPWDNLALQLAAPDRSVVLPFEHVLVPIGFKKTRWLASNPLWLAVGVRFELPESSLVGHGFTRIIRDVEAPVETAMLSGDVHDDVSVAPAGAGSPRGRG